MENNQSNYGYVEILKHVLLLVFTFGIYHLYWIYKTTQFLNERSNNKRNETAELLLSLFIPFYIIYWYYRTAEIMDEVDAEHPNKDFKTLILVFSIFVVIVSAIMVQDRINKMVGEPNPTTSQDGFPQIAVNNQIDNENKAIEEVKNYKELLDIGAITEEEFTAIKKELLNLK